MIKKTIGITLAVFVGLLVFYVVYTERAKAQEEHQEIRTQIGALAHTK